MRSHQFERIHSFVHFFVCKNSACCFSRRRCIAATTAGVVLFARVVDGGGAGAKRDRERDSADHSHHEEAVHEALLVARPLSRSWVLVGGWMDGLGRWQLIPRQLIPDNLSHGQLIPRQLIPR